jgi:hypothetical protein
MKNCTRQPFPCNYRSRTQCAHESMLGDNDPKLCACPCHKLSADEAGSIAVQIIQLEQDPETSKRKLRLFMQSLMPCGHAVGNLRDSNSNKEPFGCLICGLMESQAEQFERHLGEASQIVSNWPTWKQNALGTRPEA